MFSGKEQHEEGQEGQSLGDKAMVTITVKFLADKAKLKKVLQASGSEGDDGGEEGLGGSGKTPPAQPR